MSVLYLINAIVEASAGIVAVVSPAASLDTLSAAANPESVYMARLWGFAAVCMGVVSYGAYKDYKDQILRRSNSFKAFQVGMTLYHLGCVFHFFHRFDNQNAKVAVLVHSGLGLAFIKDIFN